MSKKSLFSHGLAYFKPYYIYRTIKWRMGDRSPIGLDLKLTTKCSLECVYCSWRQWGVPDMPKEKWFESIEEARKMGCGLAMFEGGEPTLRKDLNELVEYSKKLGFITAIFTNGVQPIDKYSPDVFWISVDNVGEKHDKIRGPGSFEKTVRNIEESNKKNIIIWITVSKLNVDDLEAICDYFSDLVAGMVFSFFYHYEAVDNISLNDEERVNTGKRLMELKSKYPNILNSNQFLSSLDVNYPVYPWATVTISPNGVLHQGCPIEHLEKNYDCSRCYMVCCREPALVFTLSRESINAYLSILGLKSSKLLWLKSRYS